MDDRSVLDLVEVIYAASLDPASWRDVSDQLGRILHGSSIIFLHDHRSAKIRPLSLKEVDPVAIDEYQSRFAGRNPIIPRALTRPEGTANAIEALIDRRVFDGSIYYNEWFRPNRFHHSTGMRLKVNDTFSLFLTFFRSQNDDEYSFEVQRLLERTAPYLRQSVELALRLEHVKAAASDFQRALASIGTSVFQLDDRASIFGANPAAQDLLETEPALQVKGGRLFLTSEESLSLSQHIQRMHRNGQKEMLNIISYKTAKRYRATLLRPTSDSAWIIQPTNLLFIEAPRLELALQCFIEFYNITPAEGRLLRALANGESINEFCSRTGVSRNTAKTQLSQLFAKTGTSKQKDLVRIAIRP